MCAWERNKNTESTTHHIFLSVKWGVFEATTAPCSVSIVWVFIIITDKGRVNGSTSLIGTCDQPYTVFYKLYFLKENRDVFVRARHAIRIAGVLIFARFLFGFGLTCSCFKSSFFFFSAWECCLWFVIMVNKKFTTGL